MYTAEHSLHRKPLLRPALFAAMILLSAHAAAQTRGVLVLRAVVPARGELAFVAGPARAISPATPAEADHGAADAGGDAGPLAGARRRAVLLTGFLVDRSEPGFPYAVTLELAPTADPPVAAGKRPGKRRIEVEIDGRRVGAASGEPVLLYSRAATATRPAAGQRLLSLVAFQSGAEPGSDRERVSPVTVFVSVEAK